MDYDYSELVAKAKDWAEQAGASGWLRQDCVLQLTHVDSRTPHALFNPGQSRPLIVAFMGGTGVGKSSLLNRLAGAEIARTGEERPTSREVTLFHHRSVSISHLPEKLPIASIKTAEHQDDAKKNIIWIDMPDFDSTEQSNKYLVLQWLPHIDVLIYVVSPERYKDDKAWRLLLAEGGKHAWLFALNQWDRGRLEQLDDFKRQLGQAGFADPIIFKTVCGDDLQADEFQKMADTISALAVDHTVAQLEQRGLQMRKSELKQHLGLCKRVLGDVAVVQRVPEAWQEQWQRTARMLQQGLDWPIQLAANQYADQSGGLTVNPAAGKYSPPLTENLWDVWAQSRLDDALDEFIGYTDHLGLPVIPIKNRLSAIRENAPKLVRSQTELAVRDALAHPGNSLQRALLKGVRVAEIVLPLAAISWVAYQVFTGYYHSNQVNANYLGVDFAIHSSLLIVIAWLTPWFILNRLKPSLRASALRGLTKGLLTGLNMIDAEVGVALGEIREQHARQVDGISRLIAQCGESSSNIQDRIENDSPLQRMLIGKM